MGWFRFHGVTMPNYSTFVKCIIPKNVEWSGLGDVPGLAYDCRGARGVGSALEALMTSFFHGAKFLFCSAGQEELFRRDAGMDSRDGCATQKRVWTGISLEIHVQARWP